MKVTFVISTTVDIDTEKLRSVLNTEGLTAAEANKVAKNQVFKILDEEYSERGRFGDYAREIRDDIREVVEELGVLSDPESNPELKVSRPDDEPRLTRGQSGE